MFIIIICHGTGGLGPKCRVRGKTQNSKRKIETRTLLTKQN
uniref:Uncharacterized protein n=1 Tax=Anguilla anguilla TaxID=7936 RepID=A0A0E9U3F2_ANGAN